MKVDFENVKFEDYEPSKTITFNNKEFRIISVEVILDDGSVENHDIADIALQTELFEIYKNDLDGTVDDFISFYASPDEYVYEIIESITGERIH